jgi:NAD(P)-dependent dehydrogenase (short-subunit alcohol dehydrogenase family)
MARIFITGSADGLGQLAARSLIRLGHEVVLHARSAGRGKDAIKRNPAAKTVLTGDLSSIDDTKELAHEANKLAPFDAVIHNAGVYKASAREIFAVNTLAPYILTCLIQKPKRLIYLTSGMHLYGLSKFDTRKIDTTRITYSDSKLYLLLLSMTVARKWPDVYSNAVNPGWVPTKMGGHSAPDNLQMGYETQVWLAVSDDDKARVSGRYFFHQKERHYNPEADNIELQEALMNLCRKLTGVPFPE